MHLLGLPVLTMYAISVSLQLISKMEASSTDIARILTLIYRCCLIVMHCCYCHIGHFINPLVVVEERRTMKFKTKMSHLNVAVDAGDPMGIDSQDHSCSPMSEILQIINIPYHHGNTSNRNTYCGVLLMDFQQCVDITEMKFICRSIICSL